MDIAEIVSTSFTEFNVGTPFSKVAGAFENQELDAVVVTDGDEYRGIVSRRQLASSSNQPSAKVGSQVQHVPAVERAEDVREVARLMIGSDAKTLPVLDDERVYGVVTADAVLAAVRPFLDAATVDEAYSAEMISATSETGIGEALDTLRESRIAHQSERGDQCGNHRSGHFRGTRRVWSDWPVRRPRGPRGAKIVLDLFARERPEPIAD